MSPPFDTPPEDAADGTGLRCPACGGTDHEVKDSRRAASWIRRRRLCSCGHRFTSYEVSHEELMAWAQRQKMGGLSPEMRRLVRPLLDELRDADEVLTRARRLMTESRTAGVADRRGHV